MIFYVMIIYGHFGDLFMISKFLNIFTKFFSFTSFFFLFFLKLIILGL